VSWGLSLQYPLYNFFTKAAKKPTHTAPFMWQYNKHSKIASTDFHEDIDTA